MIRSLPLRIKLVKPPRDVAFCLQKGKVDLVPPSSVSDEHVSFDLNINIANDQTDGPPNFRGPFVQGPPAARFLYINSGTYAGQRNSCWSRRAKVPLAGIGWELIERALSRPESVLEASLTGTARDGGPLCATVPLLNGGWKVATEDGSKTPA